MCVYMYVCCISVYTNLYRLIQLFNKNKEMISYTTGFTHEGCVYQLQITTSLFYCITK